MTQSSNLDHTAPYESVPPTATPPGAGGKRRLTIPPGVLLLLIGLCVLGTALLVATTGGIVAPLRIASA